MKVRLVLTPTRALIACAIAFAGLTAGNLVRPNVAADDAETDRCLLEELALHPNNAMAHYFRGLLHMRMANIPTARAEFDAARRADPTIAFAGGPAVLEAVERDLTSPPKAAANAGPGRTSAMTAVCAALAVMAGAGAALAAWARRRKLRALSA